MIWRCRTGISYGRMGSWCSGCSASSRWTPPKEALSDPWLMRGKIVALELLKILLENAGAVFRTSERYLVWILYHFILSLFCLVRYLIAFVVCVYMG